MISVCRKLKSIVVDGVTHSRKTEESWLQYRVGSTGELIIEEMVFFQKGGLVTSTFIDVVETTILANGNWKKAVGVK